MDKLDAMNAFARVVSAGSYAEAARRMGLTRSAVSKAVNELEHLLGVRLLDRTTRRVTPTEAGRAYHERVVGILAEVESTESAVARLHDEPKGLLKINAPMSFGTLYLGPAIAEFMAAYAELRIELILNDRFIDPIEEGFDVTVRIGALPDSSLVARKLASARRVLVASPAYLDRHGTPKTTDDLVNHRALTFGHSQAAQRFELTHRGETLSAAVTSCLCSNNGDILRSAALHGNGITLLPTFLVGPDIAAKKLKVVLPDYAPTGLDVYAVFAPNRYLAAKTRVFIDFLVERFGPLPVWDRF
ncbi:MAG TPA: LysR family transcriptional regulator [Xanthobacteraceae bacterium]|nr:LysR family transcriptional regulator [Xanthobacteraceae bacterium]